MSFPVLQTYRKDKTHKPGHGYGRNIGTADKPLWVADRGLTQSSEVVHTTNNGKPTTIEHEGKFLRDSPDVSCHDLIAKDGTVYVILPETMVAWHAGAAFPAFVNRLSFGTELHVSDGEQPTQAQKDALAWRMENRIVRLQITKARIETHRAIALPKGRKSDPEGWDDAQFYQWRDHLFAPPEPDWAKEWGTAWPYFVGSGIAQAWRDAWRLGTKLGPAVSDEFSISSGVVRCFYHGYITYSPTTGITVRRW